ncbi:MAG: 2,3-bisphosphoglycerate-independent phosphoglycerate mutase [Phycisphaerales bacterium]|jgi:2,3-bisphosphoglycerate-independent phosphoglycerate mutase|nr:2,3-bisphosphoglycerate-independent phosphoglycerate mutase [Phycisphaerales bacterium]
MGKPLVLVIRDGWGIAPDGPGNAVSQAATPRMDKLLAEHPNCTLQASGTAVGVRAGSQGSSEVGHLNMGAGRIVKQEVVRVDELIESGELFKIPRLTEAVAHCKTTGAKFHLMGLVQDQGVHAMQEHLFALLEYLAGEGIEKVFVHFFADGRDTPPRSALTYLGQLEEVIAKCGVGKVASVTGRYYAMDRTGNWDRTERAYKAITAGQGLTAASAREAIEAAYARADAELARRESEGGDNQLLETDEFITPTLMTGSDGGPIGLIDDGDVVFHTNYRQDRAIQLTDAFVVEDFDKFPRTAQADVTYIGMTRYYDEFTQELIEPMNMTNLLGDILGRNGLRQLRLAEFQKFKHVTSFFNGKMLAPFDLEDRIKVDSITIPEDQKPEMSAYEVTDLAECAINSGISAVRQMAGDMEIAHLESPETLDGEQIDDTYDVIIINFANGDMVGHTGVLSAAVKAIETVDECTGRVVDAALARGGTVLISADHGNSEQMADETGATMTAHTLNDVELVLVSADSGKVKLKPRGKLSDIAPTMLHLLGVDIPAEMTADDMIMTQ